MSATAKQITITSVVSVATLIAMLLGGWLFTDKYFARAEDVKRVFNSQSVAINTTINDVKLEDKRAQLEAIRSRQRAGATYPDDAETIARLLDDISRAQDYDDKLKVLQTEIK